MATSKAQQNATNKWIAKAYDRINLTVPKGRKEIIQAYAEANGESVNGFINRAIGESMGEVPPENAAKVGDIKTAQNVAGAPQGTEAAILTPETLKKAQEAAQNAEETVSAFIGRAVDTQAKRDRLMQAMRQKEKAPDESEA